MSVFLSPRCSSKAATSVAMPSHLTLLAYRADNSCYSENLAAYPFHPRLGRDGWRNFTGRAPAHMASMLIVVLSLVVNAGCVADHRSNHLVWEQSRIFDLTHSFGSDTVVWPTEQDFKLVVQHAEDTAGGYYYSSNRVEMPEHGGTHIDAPIHFSRGKQTLDQIPIERMVGTAIRIDVTEQCARDRDYQIAVRDLEQWETKHGRIPNHAIILLNTSYARFWPRRRDYLGTVRHRTWEFEGVSHRLDEWRKNDAKLLIDEFDRGLPLIAQRVTSTLFERPSWFSFGASTSVTLKSESLACRG
ncbi:MAG: cyclase family protein [Nitrospira sp.]|nr:MAG: cyclase family protein [Nitrospira sp.]